MSVRNLLNVKKIPGLEPGSLHRDGGGLYLRVRSSTSRSWVFIRIVGGKRYERGLGSYPDVSLARAREFAQAMRDSFLDGVDPAQITRKRRLAAPAAKPLSFRDFAFPYIEELQAGFDNAKHREQWRSTIETYAAAILDKALVEVSQDDILAVLRPIWQTKQETARRVLQRLARIFEAAKVGNKRTGDNPVQSKANIELLLGRQNQRIKHHPALEFQALPAFMTKLRSQNGVAAQALEFTILTAARTGEVIGATWGEIDLDQALWTVPAERMKARNEHKVPLSDAPVALLQSIKPDEPAAQSAVFANPAGRALSNMAMTKLLQRMDHDHIKVHGFRSTFRDWAGDTTDHAHDVIEMALAHTIKSKAEAAYRRGNALDKRRKLMADWADYANGVKST